MAENQSICETQEKISSSETTLGTNRIIKTNFRKEGFTRITPLSTVTKWHFAACDITAYLWSDKIIKLKTTNKWILFCIVTIHEIHFWDY